MYTFEQLMNMDIFDRALALDSMSLDERRQITIPTITEERNTQVTKKLPVYLQE